MSNDHRFMSAMRHAAEQAASRYTHTRIGLRTSYDPVSHAIKAELMPQGVETGWMPINPLWQGNGWGFFAPPPAGAQCVIAFQEGHIDCPIYMGALPSDQDRPLPVPDGEAWWQHQSGAFVKMTNAGALMLGDGKGATITLPGDGTIASAGTWTHTGSFSATGEATAKSQGDAVALTTHLHPLQGPGSLETGAPLPE